MKITFIGYLDYPDSKIKRSYSLAAANKKDSIINVLLELGYEVHYISLSPCNEQKFKFYKAEQRKVRDNYYIYFFSSFGGTSILLKICRELWRIVNYLIFLFFKLDRQSIIMFNHALSNYNFLWLLKRFRGIRYILDVEEIYQDVVRTSKLMSKWEYQSISSADAYLFPTELLMRKVSDGKPSIVMYGSYNIPSVLSDKFDDGITHVLYAGTLEPRKGAVAAIRSAVYLPAKYHLHVCGFGTAEDIVEIKAEILKATSSGASVTYEGKLLGDDYVRLVQSCHIGLCTQDPKASFTNTSFPSKVLSYMSNGLSVVAIAIPTLKESSISHCLSFYVNQDPKSISEAIISTPLKNNNVQEVKNLREIFKKELDCFMRNFSLT